MVLRLRKEAANWEDEQSGAESRENHALFSSLPSIQDIGLKCWEGHKRCEGYVPPPQRPGFPDGLWICAVLAEGPPGSKTAIFLNAVRLFKFLSVIQLLLVANKQLL